MPCSMWENKKRRQFSLFYFLCPCDGLAEWTSHGWGGRRGRCNQRRPYVRLAAR